MSYDYGTKGNYVRPNTLITKKALKGSVAYVFGEGKDAFVRLRAWDWVAARPGPASGKVVHRGDLVWKGVPITVDGKTYVYVSSPRRGTAGWVSEDTLRDEHPLVLLGKQLSGDVAKKIGADRRRDRRYNELSCTNGAFKFQNWLRGHVTDAGRDRRRRGPLRRLPVATAWADALRNYALKGKYVQYYLKKDKSRVTDPNDPHTPLWPGDLVTFSRSRYWDPDKKRLELVPYGKPIVDLGIFDARFPNSTLKYSWSGHVKTLAFFLYDEAKPRYTKFLTIEGHMGRSGEDETGFSIYTTEELLYRGVKRWGMVPIRSRRLSLASQKKAAHKAWDGRYWCYHRRMALSPDQNHPDDNRSPAAHEAEARRLLELSAKRRGLPTPAYDSIHGMHTRNSGLECFGFAYWKD